MNKKILILGASGLLGKALVNFFKENEYYIGILSRQSVSYASKYIVEYNIDILDYSFLEQIIKEYDIVINCTGQITNPINQCLLLNTEGISNIINAINKHDKKLIHISSVSVYGSSNIVTEKSMLNPETTYATMKCFSEYLIEKNLKNYIILRVSNLYGKHQEKGIINYLEKSYLSNNKNIYFNNNGNLKRYYLNINDLVFFIFKISKIKINGVYNMVGNDLLTIKELVAKFENILEIKFDVKYTDEKPIENINKINCEKLNKIIPIKYAVNINSYIKGLKK